LTLTSLCNKFYEFSCFGGFLPIDNPDYCRASGSIAVQQRQTAIQLAAKK
jgi:hypothetical protein